MKKQPDEQLPQNPPVPEDIVPGTNAGSTASAGKDVEEIHFVGEKTPVEHDEYTIKDDYTDYKFLKPGSRSRSHSRGRRIASSYSTPAPQPSAVPEPQAPAPQPVSVEQPQGSSAVQEQTVSAVQEQTGSAEQMQAVPAVQEQTVSAVQEQTGSAEQLQAVPAVQEQTGSAEQSEAVAAVQEQTGSAADSEVVFSQRSSSRHHHSSGSSGSSHHHHSSDSTVSSSHHHHHHHRRRRRKKMKTWKKVVLIVISSILALTLALGGVFLYLKNKGHDELFDSELKVLVPDNMQAEVQDDGDYIVYKGRTYKYNEDITSMMFIGIDKDFEDDNEQGTGGQADVLVLMAVDMKSHKMTMLAIPRDTYTEVALYSPSGHYSGMKDMQVCMAYAYGDGKETSCENTISSVRRLFYNIPIKTYYALDLAGIAAVNDSVGGVDVVSPETIEMFTKGESYHLEGRNAEHFVRLRDKSRVDSSLLRLERQKVYTKGFISTMMDSLKKDITSAVRVFNESAPYSVTNLSASKVSYLATELVTGSKLDTEMKTIPGKMTMDGEWARYDIDENAFFEQFLSVFYDPMY